MTIRKYRFTILFFLVLVMAVLTYAHYAKAQAEYQVYIPAVLRFCDGVNCAIGDPVRCDIDCKGE